MAPKFLKVERTCRYGHGPLTEVDGVWSFAGVEVTDETLPDGSANLTQFPNGMGYTVTIHQCSVCGYVEATDSDV